MPVRTVLWTRGTTNLPPLHDRRFRCRAADCWLGSAATFCDGRAVLCRLAWKRRQHSSSVGPRAGSAVTIFVASLHDPGRDATTQRAGRVRLRTVRHRTPNPLIPCLRRRVIKPVPVRAPRCSALIDFGPPFPGSGQLCVRVYVKRQAPQSPTLRGTSSDVSEHCCTDTAGGEYMFFFPYLERGVAFRSRFSRRATPHPTAPYATARYRSAVDKLRAPN